MEMAGHSEIRQQDGAVLTCTVADCTFNNSLECWAPKIQIGEDHPRCDTYTRQPDVFLADTAAVVSWCGVTDCGFNEGAHCGARGITVDQHSKHADCATFRP
jgi:hypothetical protein